MNCGVYKIEAPSGNCYVGSSNNIDRRWRAHGYALARGKHHSSPLQRAYDKWGKSNIHFSLIIACEEKDLLLYEQRCIDGMQPAYNVAQVAGSPMSGRKHTAETKQRLSAIHSTAEYREKQSLRMIARGTSYTPTEEIKNKIRYAQADRVECVELHKVFESTFDAASWCVEQGLAKSINCRVNINSATRKPESTAYGYHWVKLNKEV